MLKACGKNDKCTKRYYGMISFWSSSLTRKMLLKKLNFETKLEKCL